jgi:hypothetical protein
MRGSHNDAESRQTEAVLRRFNEVFQTHRPEALDEPVGDDCVLENTDGSRHEGKAGCVDFW